MSQSKSSESKPFAINIGPLRLSLLEKTERQESGNFLPIDITRREDVKKDTPKVFSINGDDNKCGDNVLSESDSHSFLDSAKPSSSQSSSLIPSNKPKSSSNVDSIQSLLASLAPQRKPSHPARKASEVAKGIKTTVSAARSAFSSMSLPTSNKEDVITEEHVSTCHTLSINQSESFPEQSSTGEKTKHNVLTERPVDDSHLVPCDVTLNLHGKVFSQPNLKLPDMKESENRRTVGSMERISTVRSSSPSVEYEDIFGITPSNNGKPLTKESLVLPTLINNSNESGLDVDDNPELNVDKTNQSNSRPFLDVVREPSKTTQKGSICVENIPISTKDTPSAFTFTRLAVVAVVICIIGLLWKLQISSFFFGSMSGLVSGLLSYHIYILLTTRSKPNLPCTLLPLQDLPPLHTPDYIAHDDDDKTPLLTTYMNYVEDGNNDWETESVSTATPFSENETGTTTTTTETSKKCQGVPNLNSNYVYRTCMQQALIHHYDPNKFNLSQAVFVLVTLQGTRLRIRRSRTRLNKVVLFDDLPLQEPDVQFSHCRTYNLLHAKIFCQPRFLTHKRQWNKRYPICVQLNTANNENPRASISLFRRDEDASSVSRNPNQPVVLFLFTRTMREKEHWYRLFQASSMGKPMATSVSRLLKQSLLQPAKVPTAPSSSVTPVPSGTSSKDNAAVSTSPTPKPVVGTSSTEEATLGAYVKHMSKFMPAEYLLKDSRIPPGRLNYISCEPQYLWINALVGRLFWDVLREPFWVEQLKMKLQAKLKKLHKPYFIDDINVMEIDFGRELPVLRKAFPPYLDAFGLWIDFEIGYSGGFSMSLETKMNAMKLRRAMHDGRPLAGTNSHALKPETGGGVPKKRTSKKLNANISPHLIGLKEDVDDVLKERLVGGETSNSSSGALSDPESAMEAAERAESPSNLFTSNSNAKPGSVPELRRRGTAANNSDEEDSAESSTGSDVSEISGDEEEPPSGSVSKGRLWRMVEKFAKSPYLAKAMDNKYLRRGMELVSRTSLVLQVDVQQLSGRMCINLPPPPSNRLWYGFRENPFLKLSAKPRLGDRTITYTRLVEWIESKMITEFQRMAVYPNMDDIVIPLLVDNNPRLVTR